MDNQVLIQGLPSGMPEDKCLAIRTRFAMAYDKLLEIDSSYPTITIGLQQTLQTKKAETPQKGTEKKDPTVPDKPVYVAVDPFYTFDRLYLPEDTKNKIIRSVKLLEMEAKIFEEWGLKQIEPHPRAALNFYGAPGTGKTMAAHAIAAMLGKKILIASYAEIESKYHGEGPKNVKALFGAAEEQDCVLFIDEADSLLSKRLSNVTQGSEQAINSMRSQLLINLEMFHGIVIFATNFVQNYDKAFETRVKNIEFVKPDREGRLKIWQSHLLETIPKDESVSFEALADIDDVVGRDIKNAVIESAVTAAMADRAVSMADLTSAVDAIKKARIDEKKTESTTKLDPVEKKRLEKKLKKVFSKRGR